VAASHLQVLHALEHASESAVVARAGQAGMVTIATNMAGRGTDIALEPAVRERGGLHVIVAEVNDFGRIDRQLVGRCARQGDPGTVRVFVSLDDELFQRFLPKYVCRAWQLVSAHGPLMQASVSHIMIAWAQRKAEKLASYQRRTILEQDTELERNGF
jgi:preprotein translocase subunit SecA